METVTVMDVNKNERNWYEVELEDGRTAATKDKKVADLAYASIGTGPVEADINEKQNGDFLNIYLNGIGGEGTKVAKKVTQAKKQAAPATATGPDKPSTKDADRQAAIQAQWAFGQAVTLLVASEETTYPLDTETFQMVQAQAAAFLMGAQELAKR